jgi:hypothetical protein
MADADNSSVGAGSTSLGSYTQAPEGYSLEEDAARRDAIALASKPDLPPLTSVAPMVGVGMLQPPAGCESTLYLPVERQEQLTIQNLGLSFARLNNSSPAAETTPIITDIVFIESVGTAQPITVHLGPKYQLMKDDLMAGSSGSVHESEAKHVYLAIKTEPAGTCSEAPLVDLAVVYGVASGMEDTANFEMGGGYDVLPFPTSVRELYGSTMYLCLKREGAGAVFAEQLAAHAAAEAAEAMDNESNFGGSTVGQLENDLDDELLDTSLTPAQIRELEEKRAKV